MRILNFLLYLLVLIFGVWSFVGYEDFLLGPSPDTYNWWWPQEISTYGQRIDGLFKMISVMIAVFYILTMGILCWTVLAYSGKRGDKAMHTHGSHKLEMLWTAIPAGLLLVIAFTQMSTAAAIQNTSSTYDKDGNPIPALAEIWGSQFDWRYRYPGPDGRFGTYDDIETEYELVIPMLDTVEDPSQKKLVFLLRSRDVLHSFFIPMFRFKRDAVPGMTQRIWFATDEEQFDEAFKDREDKTFDIICAELCGWGHYKMSGRVRVLRDAEYAEWMAKMVAEKHSTN
tara:strand:- start:3234 stop:4085 length:852 start_codon:yes stop_codon:yes gene_type:complete